MMLATAAAASLALSLTSTANAQRRATPAEAVTPDCTAKHGQMPTNWSGQAYAIDGDTLAGAGLAPRIRIWGIQAPELRDAGKGESVAGMRARAALEDLLSNSDHKVSCKVAKWDRYCRVVAQCSLHDGVNPIDIGGALIAGGMAYGFYLEETLPWEPKASQRYATAEVEARKARRGLWSAWLGENK